MITYEDKITAEEFLALRAHVGWVELPLEEARVCVEKVYFIICARDGEKAIGVARLMWDGGYMAFLSDDGRPPTAFPSVGEGHEECRGIGIGLLEDKTSVRKDGVAGLKVVRVVE